MNSLSDILDKKADDLFADSDFNTSTDNPVVEEATPAPAEAENDTVLDTKNLKAMIYKMKDQLDVMLRMIDGEVIKKGEKINPDIANLANGEKIVEGVFSGEKMIGSDGGEYAIPPNYASKSKLVEGDMMKLTITKNGSFVYKQISPIERQRVTGELVSDPNIGQHSVLADGHTYKILTASVTFFKGKAGDDVVILIPKDGHSDWGAVENIIKKAE